MKIITIISLVAILADQSVNAQSSFQNLNFESATLSPLPPGTTLYFVPISSALPDWTAYLGGSPATQVLQNDYTTGAYGIDIFGPNYQAAGPQTTFDPGIIDGHYTVMLQPGFMYNGTLTPVDASIAQMATVPSDAESLEFKAWQSVFNTFTVSFNGNLLAPIVIGSGANYTLYAVDISSYAGLPGQLEFTALPSNPGESALELDDITFSPNPVVPEPSILALSAIGGLLFGARKWFARG